MGCSHNRETKVAWSRYQGAPAIQGSRQPNDPTGICLGLQADDFWPSLVYISAPSFDISLYVRLRQHRTDGHRQHSSATILFFGDNALDVFRHYTAEMLGYLRQQRGAVREGLLSALHHADAYVATRFSHF